MTQHTRSYTGVVRDSLSMPVTRALVAASITAAALAAGCGPSRPQIGCTDDLRAGDLVITEVFANYAAPPGGAGTDEGREWFEVYNATDRPIELEGVTITHGRPDKADFESHVVEGITIAPGQYLTLGNSTADLLPPYVDYGYSADLGDLYNSDVGKLELRCGESVIDAAEYEMTVEGRSRQLTSAQAPDYTLNDDLAMWCAGESTEFEPNNFGTPGTESDCSPAISGQCSDGGAMRASVPPGPGDLVITEFMPEPSSPQPDKEWFEVRVMNDVDLNGLQLDRAGDTSAANTIDSPDCIRAAAGSYAVFARNLDMAVNGGLPAGSVRGRFTFSLTASAAKPGDIQVLHSGVVIDSVTWVEDTARASRQLDPDLVDPTANDEESNFCNGVAPYGDGANLGTPGELNAQCTMLPPRGMCDDGGTIRPVVKPAAGTLVITEFLANAAGTGTDAAMEWFEIQNTGATAFDLNDLTIKGNSTATDITSTECKVVAAGAYALFAHATEPETNGGLPLVDATFATAIANTNGSLSMLDGLTVLDVITWTTGATAPKDTLSRQLQPALATATDNDTPANFCDAQIATQSYGTGGNFGTPKAANVCN